MSEPLITKENYLEIGKVECNECKAVLDWNTVDEAIRKYGLIALHKESTGLGYFGYTCPHCIKTSLHETNLDFLRFLVSGNLIISETIGLESESYLNFGYYSNLTYYFTVFSCDLFDIKNPKIEIIGDRFRGDDPWFKRGYSSIYNQNHRFLNHYSSFLPDSIYIDPRLIIQFFDTESDPIFDSVFKIDSFLPIQIIRSEYDIIESCREFENQTGEKIFNRYVLLHDSIYQEMNQRWIDHYCSAKFHLSRLVLPRSRENESAKSAINRVRSILNSDPRLRNMKSANFLNTLCLNNLSSYEKDGEQHYSNFYTNEFEVDFIELKKIYFEIWDNFHDSNLQKLLVAMADNFRADYFKQIRRVDCSYKKIWILRQQYLYNIYDSMKSPQHMRRIQQGVAEKYLKKINILEEPHPNLKKLKRKVSIWFKSKNQ